MEKTALKGMFASGNMPAGAEYKAALTDILQTFPYFQLAQVLFAKQLYDTHEPEASGRIKLASVYAPDRKTMYVLFKTTSPNTGHEPVAKNANVITEIEPSKDKAEVKYNFLYSSSTAKSAEVTHTLSPKQEVEPSSPPQKESLPEAFIRKELEKLPIEVSAEKPVQTTLSKTETPKQEIKKTEPLKILSAKKPSSPPVVEKEKVEQSIKKPVTIPPIEKRPADTNVPTEEKKTATTIQKDSILKKNATPDIEIASSNKVNEPISDNSLKYNFNSWLKVIPEISIEKQQVLKPVSQQEKSTIIDEFLKRVPSISRPKAEFFSPVKAAKMSLTDDENLVSETLAKIYFTQGNLQKALRAYETLLLQFPKKKNIFAPRIEEIKALIRENTKPPTK